MVPSIVYIIASVMSFAGGISIAIFVAYRAWDNPIRRYFAIFTACAATWTLFPSMASLPDQHLALQLARTTYIFGAFCFPAFLHFILFVIEIPITPKIKILIRICYYIAGLFAVLAFHPHFIIGLRRFQPHFAPLPGPLLLYFVVFYASLISTGVVFLLLKYLTVEPHKRNKFYYILIASLIAGPSPAVHFLGAYFNYEPFPHDFMFVAYTTIFTYAILKHHLLDIRFVISRIGIFLGVYVVVLGLPLLLALLGQSVMSQWLGDKWWLIPLGITTIMASLSPFVFTRVWRKTEAHLLKKLEEKELEAATDELTGLLARRAFMQRAAEALDRARKVKQPCALMMIDLDHFKQKNDTYGHLVGDLVLMETAHRITQMFRQDDLMGRYGGEEFIILLPYTKKEQAAEVAERLRQHVCATSIRTSEGELEQTISLGLAAFPENGEDIESLIASADKALYKAKEGGRNKVVTA